MSPRAIILFVADELVWFSSTVVALVLGMTNMAVQVRLQLRMSREEALQIHWAWHVVAWGLGIISAILFVLALLDSTRTTAFYVSAVSMLVPLSLWVFIGLVFRRFF